MYPGALGYPKAPQGTLDSPGVPYDIPRAGTARERRELQGSGAGRRLSGAGAAGAPCGALGRFARTSSTPAAASRGHSARGCGRAVP